MKRTLAAACAAAFVVAPLAGAHSYSKRTLEDARIGTAPAELQAQLNHSADVLRFFSNHHWMLATRHGCNRVPWHTTCTRARGQVKLHRWLHETAQQRWQAHETGTYLGAVAYVEHYFGPQPFLRACPDGEGGYGAWVWNGGATIAESPTKPAGSSGAGSWLQFMPGTFYGIIDEAIAAARARGMLVPASARSWFSPLGVALAGRQMLVDGRRGEWTGRNC